MPERVVADEEVQGGSLAMEGPWASGGEHAGAYQRGVMKSCT